MRSWCIYTNAFRVVNHKVFRKFEKRIIDAPGVQGMSVLCCEHEDGRVSFAASGNIHQQLSEERIEYRHWASDEILVELQKIIAPGAACAVMEAVLDGTSDWVVLDAAVVTGNRVGLMHYSDVTDEDGYLGNYSGKTLSQQRLTGECRRTLLALTSPFQVADRKALDALLAVSASLPGNTPEVLENWPVIRLNGEPDQAAEAGQHTIQEILADSELLESVIRGPTPDTPVALPVDEEGTVVVGGRGPLLGMWTSDNSKEAQPSMFQFVSHLSRMIVPGSVCIVNEHDLWADPMGYVVWEGCVGEAYESESGPYETSSLMRLNEPERANESSANLMSGLNRLVLELGMASAAVNKAALVSGASGKESRRARIMRDGFRTIALFVTDQRMLCTESEHAAMQKILTDLEEALTAAALIEDISENIPGNELISEREPRLFRTYLETFRSMRSDLEQLMDRRLQENKVLEACGSKRLRTSPFEVADPAALESLLKDARTTDGKALSLRRHGNGMVSIEGSGRLLGCAQSGTAYHPGRIGFLMKLGELVTPGSVCCMQQRTLEGSTQSYIVGTGCSYSQENCGTGKAGKQHMRTEVITAPFLTDEAFLDTVVIPCVAAVLRDVYKRCAQNYEDSLYTSCMALQTASMHMAEAFLAAHDATAAEKGFRRLSEQELSRIRRVLARHGGIECVSDDTTTNLLDTSLCELADGAAHRFERGLYSETRDMLSCDSPFTGIAGVSSEAESAAYALQMLELYEELVDECMAWGGQLPQDIAQPGRIVRTGCV